jgi:hypothetical protein
MNPTPQRGLSPAHQRGRASTSSVRSFDESSEHATDYISGMYQDPSAEPPPHRQNGSTPKKNGLPLLQTSPMPLQTSLPSAASPLATQHSPPRTIHQRRISSENPPTTSPERTSPTRARPRLKTASSSPSQNRVAQIPLSGLEENGNDSTPSSPAEIAKEMFNLQAFKRMSLDVSNQVSDPDLPSTRMAIPDFTELLEAGVDQDAARLLWVPGTPLTR